MIIVISLRCFVFLCEGKRQANVSSTKLCESQLFDMLTSSIMYWMECLADCSIIFLQDGYRSSFWQFISSNTHIGWHDVYVKLLLREEKISLKIVSFLMSMTRSYIAAWYYCQMPEWQECSVAFVPIEQFWWVKHKWIGQIVFYVKGMKTNKNMLRRLTKHLSNHQDNDRYWPWQKLLLFSRMD